ncbi:MAG: hypothetical protein IPL08_04125 [Saprospiraceae bacterium]|nr:hypothetical protein [Saprospiraceae bacterium]MBK8669256.1 hypothetical protein [Saprospiraceae bacterium]
MLHTKSIMGRLSGGLIGVEVSKKIINENKSSGYMFTLPIVAGIFIEVWQDQTGFISRNLSGKK